MDSDISKSKEKDNLKKIHHYKMEALEYKLATS
jgi:hypothetical protein